MQKILKHYKKFKQIRINLRIFILTTKTFEKLLVYLKRFEISLFKETAFIVMKVDFVQILHQVYFYLMELQSRVKSLAEIQ